MKNLILQHYDGPLSDIAKLSVSNIEKYAKQIGAEYKLIRGKPFMPQFNFQGKKAATNQKLVVLSSQWDDYDQVVMMDADMFTVKGLQESIFDAEGVGICPQHVIDNAWARMQQRFPQFSTGRHAYWSGSIYKLDKRMRKELRSHMTPYEIKTIGDSVFADEGIMHRLAVLADIECNKDYILPQKWSYCSYLPNPKKNGAIIHMRKNHPLPEGGKDMNNKCEKIDSYNRLVNEGVIEG